jgi:hypothetical protein
MSCQRGKREIQGNAFVSMMALYILFAMSVFFFMYGVHDIDNAWNLRYMNVNYSSDLVDCSAKQCLVADQLYMRGLFEVMIGMFSVLVSSIALGFYSARK